MLWSTTSKISTDVIVAQPEPFRFAIDPIKQRKCPFISDRELLGNKNRPEKIVEFYNRGLLLQ